MASLNSAQQKEQYSIAFAHAVVAAAGYAFEVTTVDDDSVDFSIRSRQGSCAWARPRLDIQAKCTATADYAPSGDLRYELPLKNYDDLRPLTSDIRIPRLLLVVVVPPIPRTGSSPIPTGSTFIIAATGPRWQAQTRRATPRR